MQLRAVVADHAGQDDRHAVSEDFAPGAALTTGSTGWLLVADEPARSLGRCLAWFLRRDVDTLHIVASDGTGVLARRACEFDLPTTVWHLDGRALTRAVAAPLEPPREPNPDHLAMTELITVGGATPIVEHGIVSGDVRGVEVCRVVDDTETGAVRLEVGIGAHDREAFTMMHGDVPTLDALRGVVAMVIEHRTSLTGRHPLNRVSPERFVRWRLTEEPSRVGAVDVSAVEPPVPRPNLKSPEPAVAVATLPDNVRTTVVCSTGVYLDVVPFAADARTATGLSALSIVVPERDVVRVTEELVSHLCRPADIVALDPAATSLGW